MAEREGQDLSWLEAYPVAEEVPAAAPPAPARRSVAERAARGLGLGARDAIGAVGQVGGILYDAAAAPLSLLSLALGNRTPAAGEQPGRVLPAPRTAAQHAEAFSDMLGLPRPETPTEQVVSRVGREVGSAGMTMGAGAALRGAQAAPALARDVGRALADAPVSQLAGAAAAGGAGAAVEQAGGDEWAQLGAAVPAGVAGAVIPGALAAAGRGAAAAVAPLSERGQRRIVGQTMLGAARDPENLAARIGANADTGLPGVRQTTAEAAGDEGLFALERGLRNTAEGTPEFAAFDANRDAARRAVVDQVQPVRPVVEGMTPDEQIGAVGRAPEFQRTMRRVVDDRTAALDDRIVSATGAEANARSRLPARGDGAAEGADIRAPIAEGDRLGREQVGRLFDDIDPEGVTRLPMAPLRALADDLEARFYGPMSAPMPPALRGALNEIRNAPDFVPWSQLQALRSYLGEVSDLGISRASAVSGALTERIDNLAQAAAQPLQRASSGPRTLAGMDLDEAAQGLAARPDAAAVLDDMRGATREAREGGISLVQFLRRDPARAAGQARGAFGGIRDPDGHIRNLVDDPRRMPGLIDQRGRNYDQAMEAAIEAGYFPGRTVLHDASNPGRQLTREEFFEAIGDELNGRARLYPPGAAEARTEAAAGRAMRDAVDQELDASGTSLHDGRTAVGRALRAQEENAPAAPMVRDDGTIVLPEENRFTPEQADRWTAAIDARREHGRNFQTGPAADVLRSAKGNYQTPDSGVAQRFFRAGSGSPEAADQFIRVTGGHQAAERALYGYATRAMEDAARMPDGRVSAAKMERWLHQHGAALDRFPRLRRQLRSWAEATSQREGAEAARQTWGREQERGALRAILHMEPEEAVRSIINSRSGEENARQVLALLGNNPGAVTALRRAWLDEWMSSSAGAVDAQMRERLSPAKARRFVENTERAANVLFAPGQWRRIQQIDRDIRSGTRVHTVGRAAGSNTMQNASTAYFLTRLSGGTLSPETNISKLLGGTVGKIMGFIAQMPAERVRQLMVQAAADPALARMLIEDVTPKSAAAAARGLARLADPHAFQTWMREAGVREGLRAVGSARSGREEERRPASP